MEGKNVILHIFMYNVISDFSAATPASEGRVNLICYIQQIKRVKEIYCHEKGNYTNMREELEQINWNEELGNREKDINAQ